MSCNLSFQMSYKPLIILILSIALNFVPSQAEAPVQCGPRELFAWCMARNEATCSNPKSSGAWECDGYCICQYPYIRDHEGKCVSIEECPPRCPEASVFEICSKNYKQLCRRQKGSQVESVCIPGCSCLPDYCWEVRSKSCIKVGTYTGNRKDYNIPMIGKHSNS